MKTTILISTREKLTVCDVTNLPYMDINRQSISIYGYFETSLTAYYSCEDINILPQVLGLMKMLFIWSSDVTQISIPSGAGSDEDTALAGHGRIDISTQLSLSSLHNMLLRTERYRFLDITLITFCILNILTRE